MPEKKPQLRMVISNYDHLPELNLPNGYIKSDLAKRTEMEWIEVLNSTAQLGVWDHEKANNWIARPRPINPEGTPIIIFKNRPVATACTISPSEEEPRSEVGWVAVSPEHQGKGLGYQTVLSVLLFAKKMNYPETYLNTDDWRTPAIRTYLSLGFKPEIIADNQVERWSKILSNIDKIKEVQTK